MQFSSSKKLTSWSQSATSDNIFRLFFILWLIPLIIIAVYTLFLFNKLPDEIPLFYSRTWGEAQLASRNYIFIPMAGSLLLGICNFGLAISFHINDKVSSYLLAGTATLVALLASLTTLNIIRLIT